MKRRTLLIGVGSTAIGSGAALGSGAFTQVEADRNFNIDVADESEAYLGIVPDDTSEFVTVNDNGVLTVSLDGSNSDGATGVNPEAETRVDNILTIQNNFSGSINVEAVGVTDVAGNDASDVIDLDAESQDTGGTAELTSGSLGLEGEDEETNTDPGVGEIVDVDLVVNEVDAARDVETVTIQASPQ